jgi:hypothetical protein
VGEGGQDGAVDPRRTVEITLNLEYSLMPWCDIFYFLSFGLRVVRGWADGYLALPTQRFHDDAEKPACGFDLLQILRHHRGLVWSPWHAPILQRHQR